MINTKIISHINIDDDIIFYIINLFFFIIPFNIIGFLIIKAKIEFNILFSNIMKWGILILMNNI